MVVNRKKIVGAAAFSLALAGGGLAGAVLGVPALSGAQDDPSTSPPPPAEAPAAPEAPLLPPGPRGALLDAAAEVLDLSVDEVRSALADGQSLAALAEDQGVEIQAVVDALVSSATERLEELEAALPERMAELVEKEDWGDGARRRHRRHHLLEERLEDRAETGGEGVEP